VRVKHVWLFWSTDPPNRGYAREGASYHTESGHSISVVGPCDAEPTGWKVGRSGRRYYPDCKSAQAAAIRKLNSNLKLTAKAIGRDLEKLLQPDPAEQTK
jgi:hypothetical protein